MKKRIACIRKITGGIHMTAEYSNALTLTVPTEFSFQEIYAIYPVLTMNVCSTLKITKYKSYLFTM